MTSATQTWTLLEILGVFATMSMTMVVFSFTSLRNEMRAGFDAVGTRFDGVDRRLDGLDRDVQALSDRVFRDRP